MRLVLISLILMFFYSCSSKGPIGSAEFRPKVQQSLPVDDGEVLFADEAALYPGTNYHQMVKDRATFTNLDIQNHYKGIVAVTTNSVWFLQWNSSKDIYRIIRRYDLSELQNVELDSMGTIGGESVIILLTQKDYTVSTLSITSSMLSMKGTRDCFEVISSAFNSLRSK
jgi:hypothetical protein